MLLDIANKSIHTYQLQFSRRKRKIISLEREREREAQMVMVVWTDGLLHVDGLDKDALIGGSVDHR